MRRPVPTPRERSFSGGGLFHHRRPRSPALKRAACSVIGMAAACPLGYRRPLRGWTGGCPEHWLEDWPRRCGDAQRGRGEHSVRNSGPFARPAPTICRGPRGDRRLTGRMALAWGPAVSLLGKYGGGFAIAGGWFRVISDYWAQLLWRTSMTTGALRLPGFRRCGHQISTFPSEAALFISIALRRPCRWFPYH